MDSLTTATRVCSVESDDDWRGPNPLPAKRLATLRRGLRKLFPKPSRDGLPASMQALVHALQRKLDGEAGAANT